jgi:NADH:ubiquinone oxidoreductase subunit 6 (subunit J)
MSTGNRLGADGRSPWRNWRFLGVSALALVAIAEIAVFLARCGGHFSLPFPLVFVACALVIAGLWWRLYRHWKLFRQPAREGSSEANMIGSLLRSDYLSVFYFSLIVSLLLAVIWRVLHI